MRTVRAAGTHELSIQRSRFICSLQPVGTPDEAMSFIDSVRKEHWSATHNCTAFRVGPHGEHQRSNDDGEPSGTAGVPMLQVLVGREVTDTVAVVTRYFGGIKLGAGGLVRAYGRSVGEALDAIGTLDLVPHTAVTTTVDPRAAGRLENGLRGRGQLIDAIEYGVDHVTFHLLVPSAEVDDLAPWLARITAGAAQTSTGPTALRPIAPGP